VSALDESKLWKGEKIKVGDEGHGTLKKEKNLMKKGGGGTVQNPSVRTIGGFREEVLLTPKSRQNQKNNTGGVRKEGVLYSDRSGNAKKSADGVLTNEIPP